MSAFQIRSSVPGLSVAVLIVTAGSAAAQTPVTFNKDVAPLVWKHCAGCHRPGGTAPFSLVEYKDVRSRVRPILSAVRSGAMPPWLPEAGYGVFANERRLSADERALLEKWVSEGAREGEPDDLPPRPEWPDGWQLGQPDLVVELPQAYQLAPGTMDVFRNFVIPVPITSTRYVRGLEVRPGGAGRVHHASIAVDPLRSSRALDAADPLPGFAGSMFPASARAPESRALGWTPGMTPALDPADMAWRLDPGTDLVLLLHMIPPRSGPAEAVQLRVGLFFSQTPPTRRPIDVKLGSKAIDIPPGASSYTIDDSYTLPVDVEVLSIYPHAHYLAKEMKVFATLPDGRVGWLLWIKDWDFHWQDQYRYAQPLRLPRGTVLRMEFTYDNSAGHRANPRRQPQRVVYGGESTDEMGDVWLRLLPRTPADAATLARDYRQNELRRDLAMAEQRVESDPKDAGWRNRLGVAYVESGRVADAIVQFEQAIRLAPSHMEAHNNLGHALQVQGRLDDAIAAFREAARLAPASDQIALNIANALDEAGRAAEAIEQFQRAIALNPASAEAHNNLGAVFASEGRLEEAAGHFQRALDLHPDYADALRNMKLLQELR